MPAMSVAPAQSSTFEILEKGTCKIVLRWRLDALGADRRSYGLALQLIQCAAAA